MDDDTLYLIRPDDSSRPSKVKYHRASSIRGRAGTMRAACNTTAVLDEDSGVHPDYLEADPSARCSRPACRAATANERAA